MSNQIHPGADAAATFPGAAQLAALQQTHDVNNGAVSVTVLPDNVAAWANYKQVLESAQSSILLILWYVFKDDPKIAEVATILKAKLQQGVKVKICYANNAAQEELLVITKTEEGVPSTDEFVADMRAAGAQLQDYSHEIVVTRGTHRKALVVDNSVIIAGSRNVHWIYYESLARDKTHAEICLMIRNGTSDVVSHIARLLESGDGSAIPLPGLPGWEFVQSKPHTKLDQLGPESNILAKYIELMNKAKKSILLVQWSFIPQGSGEGFLEALIGAVKRGVQVRAVFNGVKQTKLQAKTGEASLSELLKSKKGQHAPQVVINDSAHVIHCKYMVVDDATCVLGSFNIDDYSFDKNAESVVVAQSPALAANLTAHSEWLRINMPCIPATALSGWALFSASIFGCCATAAVEAAV